MFRLGVMQHQVLHEELEHLTFCLSPEDIFQMITIQVAAITAVAVVQDNQVSPR
jgi:hypothetical protein